ncbi:hypothetical protein E2562_037608 [Oryza meyeriana var. granulata]|uniref:Aminotransferase class V domain-containing protein n=1 Tax=Oryza meyeriana var. granulata TaxID=110450 RepID=A0A6G1CY37_9ORYZ|nr:hypothetical protein E2562_037608 [Oryza meyeriana var. granulata]
MEMSHRGKEFDATIKKAEANLRALLAVPDTHEVLFLQGGELGESGGEGEEEESIQSLPGDEAGLEGGGGGDGRGWPLAASRQGEQGWGTAGRERRGVWLAREEEVGEGGGGGHGGRSAAKRFGLGICGCCAEAGVVQVSVDSVVA